MKVDMLKEEWLNRLRDSAGYDFGQVSDFNDSGPRHCTLGVLVDIGNAERPKYKPTMRSRFRNLRERLGYKIGSKIAGFNLDNREWD